MIFETILHFFLNVLSALVSLVTLPSLPADLLDNILTALQDMICLFNVVNWIIPIGMFLRLLALKLIIASSFGLFAAVKYILVKLHIIASGE